METEKVRKVIDTFKDNIIKGLAEEVKKLRRLIDENKTEG